MVARAGACSSCCSCGASQGLDYPPWRTVSELAFDFERKRVSARVLEGFDEGSTFLRRFDTKQEYRVLHGDFAECRRAYLSEALPRPELPSTLAVTEEDSEWAGRAARLWATHDEHTKVLVWQDKESGLAVAVRDFGKDEAGRLVPLMTHTLEDIREGAEAVEGEVGLFELPPQHSHESCARYPGGWPWTHYFHVYLMA